MIIALIDRHPIIRIGLKKVLTSHFEKVTILESDNIGLFQASHPEEAPDIIIMGVSHKNEADNLVFISKLIKWYPKGSTIVYDEDENLDLSVISQYLNIGVSGYLSKEDDFEKLLACVANVAEGKKYVSEAVLLRMLSNYTSEKKEELPPFRKGIKLSPREMEIAKYLTDGMKPSWISQKLGRKPSTISTIKGNIFKKLAVTNILELRERIR